MRTSSRHTASSIALSISAVVATLAVAPASAQAGAASIASISVAPVSSVTSVGPTARAIGGQLYAWGNNLGYNLGDGTTVTRKAPVPIKGMNHVTSVAQGVAVQLGKVFTWGNDSRGALGNGALPGPAKTPKALAGFTGVVKVAAYGDARYAVKSDGTLWDWGANNWRQLGDGTTTDRKAPHHVAGLTHVVDVAAGLNFAVALRSDGTVWGWGDGVWGYFHYMVTSATGSGTPVKLLYPAKVTAIAAGRDNSYAVAGGAVWALGSNDNGTTGVIYPATTPVDKHPVHVLGLSAVTQVAENGTTAYARVSSGQVKAWGFNNGGALGNGAAYPYSQTPVTVPLRLVSAVAAVQGSGVDSSLLPLDSTGYAVELGRIWSWGVNTHGELGIGSNTSAVSTPHEITTLAHVTRVVGGRYASFAIVG